MKNIVCVCAALVASGVGFVACSDDPSGSSAGYDAGRPDGVGFDGGVDASDASDADAGDAPIRERLLLSYNGTSSSELVVFDLESKQVAGRLTYPGFIGTTSVKGDDPYLLQQATDVVARLDRAEPWIVRSSWDVRMNDQPEGGAPYADPMAVFVPADTKAYVLRYTRNQLAILDPSEVADAGAPKGAIDLSGLVQAGDGDGVVEMSAGVYVPSKKRLYVLLGNIDRNAYKDFSLVCVQTHASIVAIDVETDAIALLPGGEEDGSIALSGFNPTLGGLAYDPVGDRLLVMHAGCRPLVGEDLGPVQGRVVEEVSLATGATRTLLDGNALDFPGGFAYLDEHHAVVQFGITAYAWDPASDTLGAPIPNAPDFFVHDGKGNLLGVATTWGDDGGSSTDIVSVRITDGERTVLGSNPFSLPTGFVGGVDLWPAPSP